MNYAKAKRALRRGHTLRNEVEKFSFYPTGPFGLRDMVRLYGGKEVRRILKDAKIE